MRSRKGALSAGGTKPTLRADRRPPRPVAGGEREREEAAMEALFCRRRQERGSAAMSLSAWRNSSGEMLNCEYRKKEGERRRGARREARQTPDARQDRKA